MYKKNFSEVSFNSIAKQIFRFQKLLSHCNLDIIKELCLRELLQASTTNVAFKRQKFSERSATTILLFNLVKTYYCQ